MGDTPVMGAVGLQVLRAEGDDLPLEREPDFAPIVAQGGYGDHILPAAGMQARSFPSFLQLRVRKSGGGIGGSHPSSPWNTDRSAGPHECACSPLRFW
jgi:hypothetical protein